MMANPIRVVLVDDHQVARHGLQSFLKAFEDLEVVGEAISGEEALQHIEEWMPDVVIMDLLMPGGISGIETIKQVRARLAQTRIVALTSSTDDALVGAALRAGAIGYVRKDASLEVLLASIRAAARGQSLLDPTVASVIMQELTRVGKPGVELTEREQEVLLQLALGRTNHEIAERLSVSDETVKTHVGTILTKLQLAHRTQAVIYALKKGLISLDEIEFP
jgi:NarL family two-component system response regulator LiaR